MCLLDKYKKPNRTKMQNYKNASCMHILISHFFVFQLYIHLFSSNGRHVHCDCGRRLCVCVCCGRGPTARRLRP